MSSRPSFRSVLLWLCGTAAVLALGVLLLNRGYRRYLMSVYPIDHEELVQQASAAFDVPPSLIYAVIHTESSFEEDALSSANAKGLMQLTDDTFRWALLRAGDTGKYTIEDIYDPAVNIHYGVYVLHLLKEQFPETETVLAAYNAGQGRVREWLDNPDYSADGIRLDRIPYEETAEYVRRVIQAQRRYQTLYGMD